MARPDPHDTLSTFLGLLRARGNFLGFLEGAARVGTAWPPREQVEDRRRHMLGLLARTFLDVLEADDPDEAFTAFVTSFGPRA